MKVKAAKSLESLQQLKSLRIVDWLVDLDMHNILKTFRIISEILSACCPDLMEIHP